MSFPPKASPPTPLRSHPAKRNQSPPHQNARSSTTPPPNSHSPRALHYIQSPAPSPPPHCESPSHHPPPKPSSRALYRRPRQHLPSRSMIKISCLTNDSIP